MSAQNTDTVFLDRFTYKDENVERSDGFIDYSPPNWGDIVCNEGELLDECIGYPDKWETGRGWQLQKNYCEWCPAGSGQCDRHHQSPIDLKRQVGLVPGTHPDANECIDIHWMKYEDSTCDLQQLIDSDAFTIERHGLRISQPITVYEDLNNDTDGSVDGVRLECRREGIGNRFGRIDYSKGFSHWWYLSHIDVHVPSEHTQEGKRYDAEIQLYHFYSVTAEQANGTANEMAALSVFMEAYEDAPPYRYLDKVICQWRRKEYETRLACGLDPVNSTYPGCFPLSRRDRDLHEKAEDEEGGGLRRNQIYSSERGRPSPNQHKKFQNVADVIYHNDFYLGEISTVPPVKIEMEEINWSPAEEKDWDSWILQQSNAMKQEEELYHKLKHSEEYGGKHSEELHEKYRNLIQGDDEEWFNYWPMVGVRTEYYYRYSGSQTIPPCYGSFVDESREGTNHWRVMKDPIRIHPRQLVELKRLVGNRIAPPTDPVNACKPDTAAKVTRDNVTDEVLEVDTARPLMDWTFTHFATFCECKDWESKWPEDRWWCRVHQDINERFYTIPYSFDQVGF